LAGMSPKAGDGRCRWIKDDGGRAASGIADDPHRKDETGDCVTRAIAIATGKPYREVHDALTVGKVRHLYAGGDSHYAAWSKYPRRRGGVRAFDPDHGSLMGCTDPIWNPSVGSMFRPGTRRSACARTNSRSVDWWWRSADTSSQSSMA